MKQFSRTIQDFSNEVGSGLSFAWDLSPHYHRDRLGDSLPCFRYESSTALSVVAFPRSLNPILSRKRSRLSRPSMVNFQLVTVLFWTPAFVSKYILDSMPKLFSIALMLSKSILFVLETNTARLLI